GLQQRPIYLAGVNAFAWLLATSPDERVRKPHGAEELARRCCEATRYANPRFLDTLAAAYANQNEFDRAAETASKAVDHAVRLGQATFARCLQLPFASLERRSAKQFLNISHWRHANFLFNKMYTLLQFVDGKRKAGETMANQPHLR